MNSLSVNPFTSTSLPDPLWLAIVALAGLGIAALTVWAYAGHRQATRGRLILLTALRLFALLIALFTACRPHAKVEEKPNVPSRLLIGIDLSRSMTVTDAAGNTSRIDFVRNTLKTCQPAIDDLRDRQNCEVILYAFGPSEFTADAGKYDPNAPAAAERSDYPVYLRRTLQQWTNDKYIRGHIVIGDGADNGSGRVDGKPLSPVDAAAEWKLKGVPVHTVAVGDPGTNQTAKDVAIAEVVLDPDPVAIKNKFTVRARVNAFKFGGTTVPVKVWFDLDGSGYGNTPVVIESRRLDKETNNLLEIPVDAPPELPKDKNGQERRQIKVKVEIPKEDCPGDTNPANNVVETYLNLNKEGVRVLLVDRYRYEYALLIDALAADKRIDVRKVDLQTDTGVEDLLPAFDFDKQAYDVLILGNVSPKQLRAIDPKLPEKIAERVTNKGMGFMMLGGHATLNGSNTEWGREVGWRGVKPIEDVLPVTLTEPPAKSDTVARYMVVPDERLADTYLSKIADTREASLVLWDRLNTPANKSRFTGLSQVKPKQGVNTYLWAKSGDAQPTLTALTPADKQEALLVGQQLATGTASRVLVFAAQDTYLWQRLGQPKAADGKQIHSRFWRQLVLWLAKQDQEESNAFARPEFPRIKVNDTEGIKVGLRGPNGAAVTEPKFELKVTGPGLPAEGRTVPVGVGADGSPRAEFIPRTDGEYSVTLNATGKVDGNDVTGTATAKFLAVPDTSEEMQRTAPDYDQLKSMAAAGGGKFMTIDQLKDFLNELRSQEYVTVKPTKKAIPDWRRDHSGWFLPLWMLLFAFILGAEWGLRRWWGLV